MKKRTLRVLHVEDSADDSALLIRHLTRAGYTLTLMRVETAEAMAVALSTLEWDIVIADYVLPQFSAPAALEMLKERGLDLPFIILSGAIGEHTAVAAMRAGAHDYLMKDNLVRLVPAIERELAEAAVRAERRRAVELSTRLGRILDDSANEIFVFDPTTLRFIQVNRGARQNLGYELDELLTMTPLDLKPEYTAEHFWTLAAPLLAGERDQVIFETIHRRKDRSTYPVEVRLQYSRAETPPVFVAISLDITERKRAEAEVQAATRAKDRFLAILSHEMRNPLAAVGMAARTLAMRLDNDPVNQQALAALRRNVDAQARLVNDLLDLSRIVQGKVEIAPCPMRLDELLRTVIDQMQPRALEAQLALELRECPEVWVVGDAGRLEQVLANLLHNAIKFTPHGGAVTASLERDGTDVRLVVADTGVGLAPDEVEQAFQMFWQGDQSDRQPGLGVGLALARQLVELHGGTITAQSDGPDRGSRFIVRLPVAAPPQGAVAAAAGEPGGDALRVLLVDDNVDLLRLTAEVLELEGWEVLQAETGTGALAMLAALPPPAAIVSDLDLPGISGPEFLRRARQLPGLEHVPALALSGFSGPAHVAASAAAGFCAHLVKPVDINELTRRLREAVRDAAVSGRDGLSCHSS